METKVPGSDLHKGRWKQAGGRRVRVMRKLDELQVEWIVRQKRKGDMAAAKIAETMGVSRMWVQKLRAKHRHSGPGRLAFRPPGGPAGGPCGRGEHSAIFGARQGCRRGARRLEADIGRFAGTHIPHNAMHGAMREENPAATRPKKGRRRKWVMYERDHSNSMRHADFKQLYDRGWLVSYMDDASRFITGFGVFLDATAENALEVLKRAVADHGKPSSILSDRGPRFCSSESGGKKRGSSKFETELAALGIRQIPCGAGHPQTNGKLERFHGEVRQWLPTFVEESAEDHQTGLSGRPRGRHLPHGGKARSDDEAHRLVQQRPHPRIPGPRVRGDSRHGVCPQDARGRGGGGGGGQGGRIRCVSGCMLVLGLHNTR